MGSNQSQHTPQHMQPFKQHNDACEIVPGYECVQSYDHPGSDIGHINGMNPAQLANMCNAEDACQGFNVSGYLKNDVQTLDRQYGTTIYIKK